MDGSTDTFAGFEGGNLKNSSWYVRSLSFCMVLFYSPNALSYEYCLTSHLLLHIVLEVTTSVHTCKGIEQVDSNRTIKTADSITIVHTVTGCGLSQTVQSFVVQIFKMVRNRTLWILTFILQFRGFLQDHFQWAMLSFPVTQADLLKHINAIGISDTPYACVLTYWGVWLLQQILRMLFCLDLSLMVQSLKPSSMYWVLRTG